MFFDDTPLPPRKSSVLKALPPIPETGWQRPTNFPNIVGNVKAIAFDVETREPDFDGGPGWSRGKGWIVGFSIGVIGHCGSRAAWYFPVRHEIERHDNIPPAAAFAWLKTVLETPSIPKVGANIIYDIGWLGEEGINVQGVLHDVQFAEALLMEDAKTSLEHLGQKYLGAGKESSFLYRWCADAYGGEPNGNQRANIYRSPPRLVGHYAESDVSLPLRILELQFPLMNKEGLLPVYRMECDSIPLLVASRRAGARINISAAEKLYEELGKDIPKRQAEIYKETGVDAVNVNASADLVKVFDAIGIKYPRTKKGAPSFKKDFLKALEHPVAKKIVDLREVMKIQSTFIKSYLLDKNTNGFVHCQFHPLRDDESGTRSGRDSSSTPNLQNIPTRTALGKKVRQLFIPDDGHIAIESDDFSQIEYRWLAHFACGPGADAVRERYNADPSTDYHEMTQALVKQLTGIEIERKPIKNINFGLLYGMGEKLLAKQIGVDKEKASEIFTAYHTGNPYVKASMDAAASEAEMLGYVTTVLMRRSRFDYWEPMYDKYDDNNERRPAFEYNIATRIYGDRIKRAYTHKAINRRLQGSAGDTMKAGRLAAWKAGVFAVTGVPRLYVHDELVFSVIEKTKAQWAAFRELKHIMQTAIPCRVPIVLERARGANWGDANESFCDCYAE